MTQAGIVSRTQPSRRLVQPFIRVDILLFASLAIYASVLLAYILPTPDGWKESFDFSYAETLFLTLVVALFARAATLAQYRSSQLFRSVIAVAFSLWLLVSILGTFFDHGDSANMALLKDTMFVIYFSAIAGAIELRLDKNLNGSDLRLYAAEALGSVLLLMAVFLYFGILPLFVLDRSYSTPYALHAFMDGYISARFMLAAYQAKDTAWRWFYIGFASVFLCMVVADLLSLAYRLGYLEYRPGNFINILWYTWFPVAMMIGGLQFNSRPIAHNIKDDARISIATRGLLVFGLSLPLLHVSGYAFELFALHSRQPRDALVGTWILIFALLLFGLYFYFRRHVDDLDEQLHDAEDKAGQLENQLNRELRIRSLGRLSAGLAHDFANTLTAVSLYENIIRDRVALGKPVDEELDGLAQSIGYATDIVDKLRLFSNSGAQVTTQILDLNEEARSTVKLVRSALPDEIKLTLVEGASDASIMAESPMAHQVLINFIYNAADALSNTGEINVSITQKKGGPSVRCASCNEMFTGNYHLLVVSDTGPGIAPEVAGKIFEPLVSTKPVGEGSGLGLSTVHVIMHSVGGHVGLTTTLGKGSRFEAYFPALKD